MGMREKKKEFVDEALKLWTEQGSNPTTLGVLLHQVYAAGFTAGMKSGVRGRSAVQDAVDVEDES